jgi:hypothetical protein
LYSSSRFVESISSFFFDPLDISRRYYTPSMNAGPCHHGMAGPQVADGGTASYMEGSCE